MNAKGEKGRRVTSKERIGAEGGQEGEEVGEKGKRDMDCRQIGMEMKRATVEDDGFMGGLDKDDEKEK